MSSKEVSLAKNKRIDLENLKEGKSKQSDVLTYVKKEEKENDFIGKRTSYIY